MSKDVQQAGSRGRQRDQRLAEALKDNLKRRKAARRGADQAGAAEPDPPKKSSA